MVKRFDVRGMPDYIRGQLTEEAEKRNLSFNKYVLALLNKAAKEKIFSTELIEIDQLRRELERNNELLAESISLQNQFLDELKRINRDGGS